LGVSKESAPFSALVTRARHASTSSCVWPTHRCAWAHDPKTFCWVISAHMRVELPLRISLTVLSDCIHRLRWSSHVTWFSKFGNRQIKSEWFLIPKFWSLFAF
jgi:hypothetical protein